MKAYLALLRHRPQFRYLWFAQVISLVGDWFNTIATVILVSRYTNSGLAVSLLFLARGLPPFLFGPIAGVVADRFNRRIVLIVSDVLRMVIVLGFLLVTNADRVWLLYVFSALQFMVSAFFEPARSAILPSLIEEKDLLVANTLSSATWSAVLAFGAVIGGITTALFGVEVAILFDSATFLLSAFLIYRIIQTPKYPLESSHQTNGWGDLVDGFRYVAQNPRVGVFALVKGMAQVGSVDIMFALYAESVFVAGKEGSLTLGILYTFFGIGAVAGPMVITWLGDGSERFLRRSIWWGFVLLGLGWLGFGTAPFLLFAAFAILVRGAGGSIGWTYSSVLIQMKVPDRLLGRVFALDFSIFTLCYVLSVWITGVTVDSLDIDPRPLSIVLAIGCIVPLVLWTVILRDQDKATLQVALAEGD